MNRAAQLPSVKKVIQLGQRGLANDEEAMANARKAHTTVITAEQIHRKGVERVLAQIPSRNIYITLDVDVMDPTLAPGTETLEPDGLNFSEIDERCYVEGAIDRNGCKIRCATAARAPI